MEVVEVGIKLLVVLCACVFCVVCFRYCVYGYAALRLGLGWQYFARGGNNWLDAGRPTYIPTANAKNIA